MPSIHSSVTLKFECDFVVKLLTIARFTHVSKNNYRLYLFIGNIAKITIEKLQGNKDTVTSK